MDIRLSKKAGYPANETGYSASGTTLVPLRCYCLHICKQQAQQQYTQDDPDDCGVCGEEMQEVQQRPHEVNVRDYFLYNPTR